ncbi:lactoylglutathione lyase [Streptomyces griseochromogenes]|uniref:Glyoxalase n=1 Tax=Streptomyces griseochromogenes TaxID=68214 RepID=A0A1B1B8F8_9ACTN|nr:VOC family protein [Streptomyces griseochromogenes]ANP55081.1 glyoxalase [Streptomyces griseochromogenes]MBP2050500.1 lactoylglutathione lyase [Streptomyces griseochromogenes]
MTLRTGHTGLNVTDLDRSLAFYRDVLGFALLAEGKEDDRRYAFLGDGGDAPVLTLWQQAREPYDDGRAGLHHLAFTADSMDRVRVYETALRGAGVEFHHEGVVAHGEGAASGGIFFHDPDGTRLEISAPLGAEQAPAPHTSAPTCGFF